MMNFGKFTPMREPIEQEIGTQMEGVRAGFTHMVIYRNPQNQDLVDVLKANPHPFYIAVDAGGYICSMSNDPEQIQIDRLDIIGIDSDFGFTYGEGGNVYGALWDGEQIVAPPVPAPDLSPRQLRTILHRIGKMEEVEIVIASMPQPQRGEAEIAWGYATSLRRDHPLIVTIAPLLGLSDEEVDDLWLQAANIKD